jgi:hypothetical protein
LPEPILQGTYDGQTVFYVSVTDPICNGMQTITRLYCEGKLVKTITPNDYQAFLEKVTNVKNISA